MCFLRIFLYRKSLVFWTFTLILNTFLFIKYLLNAFFHSTMFITFYVLLINRFFSHFKYHRTFMIKTKEHVENTNSTFSVYKHETNVIKQVFIIWSPNLSVYLSRHRTLCRRCINVDATSGRPRGGSLEPPIPPPLFLNILWKWTNLVSNYFIFMGYLRKMENFLHRPDWLLVCLFDFILYVHSTIFQLCGTVLPGFNQY